MLLNIGREASFSARPILEILRAESPESYPHIAAFMRNVCNVEKGTKFKDAWCENLTNFNNKMNVFETDEMSLLMNFGTAFGSADISSGMKLIKIISEYLEKSEESARSEAERQGKLRLLLPIYAGVVACILLV